MKFNIKTLTIKKPSGDRFFVFRMNGMLWRHKWQIFGMAGVLKINQTVLIIASLLSTSIFAQNSFSPEMSVKESTLQTIDIHNAIALTINKHPELKKFVHQIEMYKGYAQQEGVKARPQIGFLVEDALGTGKHSGFRNAQSTLSISWILDDELVKRKIETAIKHGSTIELKQAIKTLDLAAQTTRYFINVLANKERLKLAKLSLKQSKKSFALVLERVRAGKSSLVDKFKSQAEIIKRELIVEDLIHKINASKYQLVAQWQETGQELIENNRHKRVKIVGSLSSLPNLFLNNDYNSLFNKIKQLPSVTLFASKQRITQSEIELARIASKPLWEFTTGVRRFETTDDFGLVAGISIPFGNTNKNQGKIRSLRASQSKLESESIALIHKLNTQLYLLIKQLKHNQRTINTITNNIIPILEQTIIEANRSYKLGKYSYTEWINTQQTLLNIQFDLITAYQNAHLNNIEIERLTGTSLTTINKASNPL